MTTLPGSPLSEADYVWLEASWIPRELADTAMLRRVTSSEGAALVGRNDGGDYAGIIFVYTWPGEHRIREFRLRRDRPDIEYKDEKRRERGKYLGPPGRSNLLYFPPDTPAAYLEDVSLPIIVVEGEKKALASFRLSWEGLEAAERPRFLVIGIPGVWNWRGTIAKENGPTGERRDVKGPIADLRRICWPGRKVYLLFDTNVHSNQTVAIARLELAKELRGRGAEIWFPELPPEEGVNGIDDFLARHGPKPALRLLDLARPFSPKDKLTTLATTDYGAEQAFEILHGTDFLYDHSAKQWLRWVCTHWGRDEKGAVDRAMLDTAKAMLEATVALLESDDQKKYRVRFAFDLQNMKSRAAALKSATTNPKFARTTSDFDRDPDLLGVANGVADLRAGRLMTPQRGQMITKVTSAPYIAGASSRRWSRFLEEIFEPHPELVPFIQRAAGYSTTGHTREQCLFLLYGPSGANGKSTFLRVLQTALGQHASTAEFSTFASDRDSGRSPRDDIADLYGARMVVAQESRPGARLAESIVKWITGRDQVRARKLYQHAFSFEFTGKIWLATNYLPRIVGTDDGIWRRIYPIPFEVSFLNREDKSLLDDLLESANQQAILAWTVEGAHQWYERGLEPPEVVLEARKNYRHDQDQVARFIDELCVQGDAYRVGARRLYSEYKAWAEGGGEYVMTETLFCRRLHQSFGKQHTNQGALYLGIGIRSDGKG